MAEPLDAQDRIESQLATAGPSDYDRLVRFVVAPSGRFGLAIARCSNTSVREGVMTQAILDAKVAGTGVDILDLATARPDADLVDALVNAVGQPREPGKIDALFVKNLDHLLVEPTGTARATPAIEDLNRRRDTLPAIVAARIVLWLSDPAAEALAQAARDLYDVVLTFFRFDSPAWPRLITSHDDVPPWLYAAPIEEHSRLKREAAILESVVSRSGSPPRSVADALARLGQIHMLLGDASHGQPWLTRAVQAYEELGDASAQASVLLRLGDAERVRGDLDGATGHYEAARLLYERLGDVRLRAITMGKIADILQVRGELDEALRIRREEELPVYERLGDARERTITMGKIADILQARGELDEALRIRREEELPVYERLGDVRERAITMGRIADILQARGQVDEALRIRREEELPVYERLGDVRSLVVARANMALSLAARGGTNDRSQAGELLGLALADAEKLRIPEAKQIRVILKQQGLN